jgi:hypothetical protein
VVNHQDVTQNAIRSIGLTLTLIMFFSKLGSYVTRASPVSHTAPFDGAHTTTVCSLAVALCNSRCRIE